MKKMLLMFVAVLGLSISANAQWGYYDQIYYQNSFQNHMNQCMYYYNQAQQQFNNYMNNVAQQPVYYSYDYNYNSDYITSNSDNCHSSHSSNYSESNSTPKTCNLCNGTGKEIKMTYVGGSTPDKWCSTCNKKVYAGHYHARCSLCGGDGIY